MQRPVDAGPVRGQGATHSAGLLLGELGQTGVVRIIHEIVDRIGRATTVLRGAVVDGLLLCWRVADEITISIAPGMSARRVLWEALVIIEGVQQPKVVAHL